MPYRKLGSRFDRPLCLVCNIPIKRGTYSNRALGFLKNQPEIEIDRHCEERTILIEAKELEKLDFSSLGKKDLCTFIRASWFP